jgi:cell division protease FtsH
MIPRGRLFVWSVLALLAVNLVISFATGRPEERERVPYQPFFVDQVEAGNVAEISTRADSIEGELKSEATFDPPGDAEPVAVTRFETEVPAFIDPAALTRRLESVGSDAQARRSGAALILEHDDDDAAVRWRPLPLHKAEFEPGRIIELHPSGCDADRRRT